MRDFLENRTAIATSARIPLPVESPLLHHSLRLASAKHQELPKLELNQDAEGRIKEIVITCHCGERIVLQCTY